MPVLMLSAVVNDSLSLRQDVLAVLQDNILPFWLYRMSDPVHGGFYGQMRGDGTVVKDAVRGAILTSRLLWTFAAAYRALGKEEYLSAAESANAYLLSHFVDADYGGVYWSVAADGTPADTKKQFYALAFAIYGLAEYSLATGDDEALECACSLFATIEAHAVDPVHGGYIEALSRSWHPLADVRLSAVDANAPKSQNTHLHILEAYTALARCLRERKDGRLPQVTQALGTLLTLFCDTIIDPSSHHLVLFFNMDWTRCAGQTVSYGHDIECSWLLHEAALVLGDDVLLRRVEALVPLLAAAASEGLTAEGGMIHEADSTTGYVDADRHWWVQAEAVVGYYNLFQHFHLPSALDSALSCWHYIKEHLIDYAAGEWHLRCAADGSYYPCDDRAGFWKCPYHNSRMCLELLTRIPDNP